MGLVGDRPNAGPQAERGKDLGTNLEFNYGITPGPSTHPEHLGSLVKGLFYELETRKWEVIGLCVFCNPTKEECSHEAFIAPADEIIPGRPFPAHAAWIPVTEEEYESLEIGSRILIDILVQSDSLDR